MHIGPSLKQRRIDLGLSEARLASLIRDDFEPSLLQDLEAGDDNDADGWLIRDLQKYCSLLGIEPVIFADLPCSDLLEYPLADLVRRRRLEKGWSIGNLSDRCGYENCVLEAIEAGSADSMACLDVLREISKELDLPLRLLLSKLEPDERA